MATVRKYDNGPNGWTDYDSKGNAVAAGTYNAPGTARNPFNAAPGAGGGINSGEGSLWNNATGQKVSSGGSSGNLAYTQPSTQATQAMSQSSYEQKLADLARQTATAAADAKKFALKQAWEGNSQALNAQNATVDNNFNSAKNNLTALQASRSGEYQGQKDATSQEAAAQLRRTQALNALTGNYNSGYNRSQMSDVGLARQGSLDSITNNQNTFNSGVSNQISDADAQRVAALNDIAGKLQLGQKQLNDGTLNLSTQLASDVAIGSLKASLDSQAWAERMAQQGIDNTLRQSQLDQSISSAAAAQAFNEKQFSSQNDQWLQGFNADKAQQGIKNTQWQQGYDADRAQLGITNSQWDKNFAADNAYRNDALSNRSSGGSGSSGSSYGTVSATAQKTADKESAVKSMTAQIQAGVAGGMLPSQLEKMFNDNASTITDAGLSISNLKKEALAAYNAYHRDNRGYQPM